MKHTATQPLIFSLLGVCLAVAAATHAVAQTTPAKDAKDAKEAAAALVQPFVTVNGEVQVNARAEVLLREQLSRGTPDSAELRKGLREELINQALMAQQARKAGLDKEPLVQAQIDVARQTILAQMWQQKVVSELVIKDEELKAEYDRQVARMGNQEYQVRHLLVAEEATAKLLIDKIRAGAKLADLASEYSRDTATQGHGGLTEWNVPVNLHSALAEVLPKLEKGKVWPQPVRSAAGWHVLQLEDKRAYTPPTLEASKPQLTQIIARQTLASRLQALKAQAKLQ
jgi:peptidyl-prolyl cis-trans isomerase C